MVKEVAEQVGLMDNLKAVVKAVRDKSIQVFIVPHHRWEPGDYERWKHANHSQIASAKRQTFAKGIRTTRPSFNGSLRRVP
jgi:hypothetical protein